MINFDLLNFIIAVLALLVAVYSIFYTHRQNRHRIIITSGERYINSENTVMHCFDINNICPSPVTLMSICFRDTSGKTIEPIDYEPEADAFCYVPDYMYSSPLCAPCLLQPYQDLAFGYYFTQSYECINVTIVCDERIHRFKKRRSFLVHFTDIQE